MSPDTFDKVSAVLWGQNALNYQTNYIIPRAHWTDSDIRDEALYYAGVAHGLRLGAAAQKSNQPVMLQDKQSWYAGEGENEIGSGIPSLDIGKYVAFQPRVSPKPTSNDYLPFENGTEVKDRLTIIEHAPETSHVPGHWQDTYNSTWGSSIPEIVGRGQQENKWSKEIFVRAVKATFERHRLSNAEQRAYLDEANRQYQDTYNSTSEYSYPEMISHLQQMNETSKEVLACASRAPDGGVRVTSVEQRENFNEAKVEHQKITKSLARLSALDQKTPFIPLTDSQATQDPVKVPARHLMSQAPVAASKPKNILAPLIDSYIENYSDEDDYGVLTPSTYEESDDEGGFDDAMEQWLEAQGENDDSMLD